jgi:hypothetical protein
LPLFRYIRLLEILGVLITQLEVHVLYSLLDPLLTTDTDDRANTLFDTPGCSNASHAHIVLLCKLFNALTLVYKHRDELVSFGALGRSVGEGACEGTTSNGRPWDEPNTSVLTVRDLTMLVH